jgi:hypothetical protein
VDDVLLDLAPLGLGEAAPADGQDTGFLGGSAARGADRGLSSQPRAVMRMS